MNRHEREIFVNVPMISAYSAYTGEDDFPRREIVYLAMPDQILRAAFMLTWKAGATWKEQRRQTIKDALAAIDLYKSIHPAMRIKKPTANQEEKLSRLIMLVDKIHQDKGFKSKHQFDALKAILASQKGRNINHLSIAGEHLYAWLNEK